MAAARMDSAHGTKTVRLQRKKSGLDFSVKGGQEHGIPIVVSWIKEGGAAAKHLRLGDVILAVNGRSLQGASHSEAVSRLKQTGSTVLLRVKPNQLLRDVFLMGSTESDPFDTTKSAPESSESHWLGHAHTGPLPTGWERKVDTRTGRPYYENHYTETTSWTDPRSLHATPLHAFDWTALPSMWERQLTDQGDIYYVCHDTQTTHWDSPRGLRQQKQLKELSAFLQHHKQQLRAKEAELTNKRELLLEKNTTLGIFASPKHTTTTDTLQLEPTEVGEDDDDQLNDQGESPGDVINEIMSLNEEVDDLDEDVTLIRSQLKKLAGIISHAQYEDIGEEDEYEAAAKIATDLSSDYLHFKSVETKLHEIIKSLEELRQEGSLSDTPLQYIMQLPPMRAGDKKEEGGEKGLWLHTLPDRLTGKTNCEMRVECCLLREMITYAEELQQRLATMYGHAVTSHGSGWGQIMGELVGLDFTPFQDQWLLDGCTLQEKLEKLVPQD